jgi:hypothetical protein
VLIVTQDAEVPQQRGRLMTVASFLVLVGTVSEAEVSSDDGLCFFRERASVRALRFRRRSLRPSSALGGILAFAFLIAITCEGSEVMIWSSVYEAMVLMATCLRPAKKMPSPTSDSSKRYFSSSVRLNVFCTKSTDDGDCLSNT